MSAAEIIGLVSHQRGSETIGFASPPTIDVEWIRTLAQAHERAGFDRVLIGYSATSPDGFAIAQAVLAATTTLKVLIAHRPGFVAPTLEARKLITLDHLSGGGRVAIHHISGGSDADQQRDGDYASKRERYARTGEFIDVLRRTLAAEEPFSYSGDHYRVSSAFSSVRPATDAGIPIYIGGQSDDAVRIGAQHADTFALFGEPLEATRSRIDLIDAEAARHGRTLDYSLSTRPIVGETEDAAWLRAERVVDDIGARRAEQERRSEPLLVARKRGGQAGVSDARLQAHAADQDVHDERLWFGATRHGGYAGNSSGHVGTAAQVADSLDRYWELGVRKFLIRGFDPLADVETWGEALIPELRARFAARTQAKAA